MKYQLVTLTLCICLYGTAPALAAPNSELFKTVSLPLSRSALPDAVKAMFSEVDKNHNAIYDPKEQLQDALQSPDVSSAEIQNKIPACTKLGVGIPAPEAPKESDYTPLPFAQVLEQADKAFSMLDANKDNVLSTNEVALFEAESAQLTARMNEKCQSFGKSAENGELPDPNLMMDIINQMTAMNKRLSGM